MTFKYYLKSINNDNYVVNFGIRNDESLVGYVIIYGKDGLVYTVDSKYTSEGNVNHFSSIWNGYIPSFMIKPWEDIYADECSPYISRFDFLEIRRVLNLISKEEKDNLPSWFKEMLILEELKK